ncbi:ABC transporter transmembrane domain-containing protein [Tessaracoccus palaemonis]|uniref:ABC transporter ATP-binding protein/permease n=1 Tax=Tessaracoccus palaemonis TaxID=2829499 RepID=A0ABX8SFH2_9ACTN|nr:ABC transporter ATP-binding protein [Tessaracoccus palaemonis]QXT61609.1 ABC transporter ATP-binding protein/permease [Tessaracoccus palaemonis]
MKIIPEPSPATSVGSMLSLALTRGGRGWRLGLATFGYILHQACETAIPILIGVIVDLAIVRHDAASLVIWLAVLGGVFVVLSLSYQLAALAMVRVYGHGEHDLRQLAIGRVLHPRGLAVRRGTGEVLSIASSDTYRVAGVAWSIALQGATVASLLTAGTALLVISVPLGVGVFAGAIAVLLGMQALARPLERLGMAEQTSGAAASEVATDVMSGLRIVRGLGAEDEAVRRYRIASAGSLRGAVSASRHLLTYQAVSSAVSVVYLGVLTFAAAWLALRGDITPGQLVTVVALAQFLQGALEHIGTFGGNWAHKRASSRRVQALLTDPFLLPQGGQPCAPADAAALTWRTASGVVETVPGRLVGVQVGSAAMARTVSARLGLRALPDPGEVSVHGADALAVGPERYRRVVAAPPHDATLFTGTLRENVSGIAAERRSTAWDEDVVRAVALDDVLEHVGSPEAEIGEGGRRLSGGQRQRVLLARALHDPAEVVILDEPTSALDPLTELQVAEGLRRLGRTIVVVSSSRLVLNACHYVFDLTRSPLTPAEPLTEVGR